MKVEVLRAYTDRIDKTVHLKGSFVELEGGRLEELSGKGIVEAPAGGKEDEDFSGMTVAELKEYIEENGGAYEKSARKAELVAVAEGL